MARSSRLFVGPYAEWTAAGSGFDARDPRNADPRWADLFDGPLEWNIGIAGYGGVLRGDRFVEVPCCMPAEPRPGCPRWPMALELAHGDWHAGPEPVTDWTGTDPARERDWFATAFASELAVVEELAGHAPVLRWGLLFWVTG